MFTLKYAIETPLDQPLDVGRGASFLLEGWAYCYQRPIRHLFLDAGGKKFPITERRNIRQDILVANHTENAPAHNIRALRSGFWIALPLRPEPYDRALPLRLVAELDNGEVVLSKIHTLHLKASPAASARAATPLPERPRVCICMTTYNPSEAVFRRQIDSIRNQTYANWTCIIQDDWSNHAAITGMRRVLADDPRFLLRRNEHNLGFYFNFERVLNHVPPGIDLVALADQDDNWFPDKLATLVDAVRPPGITLAYSDMRIVDTDGKVISNTFWSTRRNNYTDLETLFFANTITGAALIFKATLLPLLLPFPPKRGHIYHDWWIGLIALATGRIAYVDRPLYDYFQHGANAVGWAHIGRIASISQFIRSDPYRRELAQIARTMYNTDCKFLAATIQTLRLRVPESDHDAAINRLQKLIDRPLRTLLGQSARAVLQKRASQNREKNVLMAHAVMRMLNAFFARKHREISQRFATPEEAAANQGGTPTQTIAADNFERKVKPFTVDVRPSEPPRINMILATIDFKYFFGGYIGMFQLAKHIAQAGFKTRFIIADSTDFQPGLWRQQIRKYAGLEDIFDLVEIEYRFDRSVPLPVSPHDRFIATSCWSAWLADNAARQVNGQRFIFMIQEYEPFFVAHGSFYALSHAAYDLNLYAVFSTEILRDFFRTHRFGIYRDGAAAGDARSIAFQNAILKFNVSADRIRRGSGEIADNAGKRKFLYYCRPEAHAQRNMFELGILALRRAISEGTLDPARWQLYGIGTVGEQFSVPLPNDARMIALPKMSLQEYAEYLPDFDLGMSLMYTPHPSLVPLEMAAAGLLTVTNTYANKTADALRAISTNFEVGEASIDDLAAALKRAEARVNDIPARVEGAAIHWPTSWDEAFSPAVLAPLLAELAQRQ